MRCRLPSFVSHQSPTRGPLCSFHLAICSSCTGRPSRRQLFANAAIADSRVAAYPCVGMLCLPDSAGQVFRLRPWCGQRDSSVKEGGSKYESNIVPDPAIREAIDSDVQKEASKQGKQ